MLQIKDLSLIQGDFKLENINLKIEKGEYVVLMGRTGCGKTSLLEAVCGLRKIDAGEIHLGDFDISHLKPSERSIGYVPQDAALFSSMNVEKNIGFALRIRKWTKADIAIRVKELSDILGLGHLLKRKINDLSGGEKQRISLARALAFYPDFLCLDEPLSALDEPTRDEMYALLKKLKHELNITALHISHSSSDADKLADKLVRIEKGKIIIS